MILHLKRNARALDDRAYPVLVAFFPRHLKRPHQRHGRAAGRIRTGHGPRPQPRDHRGFAALHQCHLGVETSDAPVRLLAHPTAVIANVVRQPRRTAPSAVFFGFIFCRGHAHRVRIRIDRRPIAELGRQFDQRLGDEHGDRVEIRPHRLQPEPLRLQWNGAAARERIVNGQRLVRQIAQHICRRRGRCLAAGAGHGSGDLVSRLPQQHLHIGLALVRALPLDQLADDPVQPLALVPLCLLGAKLVGTRRRVIHHTGKNDRATRRQGPPRPPQMQGGRMAVPNRLLARRLGVDLRQGQIDLDELRAYFRLFQGYSFLTYPPGSRYSLRSFVCLPSEMR